MSYKKTVVVEPEPEQLKQEEQKITFGDLEALRDELARENEFNIIKISQNKAEVKAFKEATNYRISKLNQDTAEHKKYVQFSLNRFQDQMVKQSNKIYDLRNKSITLENKQQELNKELHRKTQEIQTQISNEKKARIEGQKTQNSKINDINKNITEIRSQFNHFEKETFDALQNERNLRILEIEKEKEARQLQVSQLRQETLNNIKVLSNEINQVKKGIELDKEKNHSIAMAYAVLCQSILEQIKVMPHYKLFESLDKYETLANKFISRVVEFIKMGKPEVAINPAIDLSIEVGDFLSDCIQKEYEYGFELKVLEKLLLVNTTKINILQNANYQYGNHSVDESVDFWSGGKLTKARGLLTSIIQKLNSKELPFSVIVGLSIECQKLSKEIDLTEKEAKEKYLSYVARVLKQNDIAIALEKNGINLKEGPVFEAGDLRMPMYAIYQDNAGNETSVKIYPSEKDYSQNIVEIKHFGNAENFPLVDRINQDIFAELQGNSTKMSSPVSDKKYENTPVEIELKENLNELKLRKK